MLVQISIKNFKTFKEEAILSLVASNYTKEHAEENVFYATSSKIPLLKSAVIYGANASGKSKLIEAIVFFKDFIKKSSKESQAAEPIRIASHRLNTTTENAPSLFEFIFVENNELYRYGFEVDQTKVHAEWLYHKPKTKEVEIFYREAQEFELHSTRFRIGKKLVGDQMIRENALLLSVAAQFNDPLAIHILEWLNHFNIISGIQEEGYEELTVKQLDDPTKKDKILKFIQFADLGIEDLMLKEIDVADLPKDFPNDLKELLLKKQFTEIFSGIRTLHRKYDEKNLPLREMESFSMSQDESSGTQKYFALSGIILDALESGGMLVIDELDAKLHPILVHNIVALFNSRETNPKNAQLIFATHDTNLLSSDLFRRDQIWFTEKDRYGASSLYSLADFKKQDETKVRNDENYEKNYIGGRYGGIPYIGNFKELFNPGKNEKEG